MAHWSSIEISSDLIQKRFKRELKKNKVEKVEVAWREGIDTSSRWQIKLRASETSSKFASFSFGQIHHCCGAALAYVATIYSWMEFDPQFILTMIEWCSQKVKVGSVYIIVKEENPAYGALKDMNGEYRCGWQYIFSNKNPRSSNTLHHWLGKVSEF